MNASKSCCFARIFFFFFLLWQNIRDEKSLFSSRALQKKRAQQDDIIQRVPVAPQTVKTNLKTWWKYFIYVIPMNEFELHRDLMFPSAAIFRPYSGAEASVDDEVISFMHIRIYLLSLFPLHLVTFFMFIDAPTFPSRQTFMQYFQSFFFLMCKFKMRIK